MDRLAGITAFVRVAERGGFSAAARHLNLSTSTVSDQVQALENALGVRLLNRTTRRVSLTEIGREYYERCSQILHELAEADEVASALQVTPRGRLRVYSHQGVTRLTAEVATRFLYLAPELAAPLPDEAGVVEVVPLLRELILHVLKLRMLHPDTPEQDRLARLLVDLLLAARPIDLALPLPADRRAVAFADQVRDTPGESAGLADLARRAGASLRTLQRLFPAETGLTLEAWRQKARLITAAAALSGGAPVAVTAADCGYDSPSAFITAFKRQFGVTPGRYRPAPP